MASKRGDRDIRLDDALTSPTCFPRRLLNLRGIECGEAVLLTHLMRIRSEMSDPDMREMWGVDPPSPDGWMAYIPDVRGATGMMPEEEKRCLARLVAWNYVETKKVGATVYFRLVEKTLEKETIRAEKKYGYWWRRP